MSKRGRESRKEMNRHHSYPSGGWQCFNNFVNFLLNDVKNIMKYVLSTCHILHPIPPVPYLLWKKKKGRNPNFPTAEFSLHCLCS